MEMLSNVWYCIIGFCIIMYVLLDGFDLGIGILFPFFDEKEQNIMMSTILPVWDGNQTWLVLGVACLYGAFPHAFSLLLPVLYLPLLFMVLGLLLRGITFEFRLKEKKYRKWWSFIFFVSSVTITFIQGLLVGSFVKGFEVGPQGDLIFSLLTPFNITCGFALLFGYALLGITWLIAKTTGDIQKQMYLMAQPCLWIVVFFLGIISLWSPFIEPDIWQRWFGANRFYRILFLPSLTAVLVMILSYSIRQRYEYLLYWLTVGIFLCSYIGFGISTWPYLIPHHITIWQVAAPPSSQIFMLIGTLLLLPILIGYTSYAYYIFRDKVKDSIDY